MTDLKSLKVAILVDNGFEQSELLEPRKALEQAGATTVVVSPQRDTVRGWNHGEWGENVKVDAALDSAKAEQFDALLLPGGVMNPDHLRSNARAVAFAQAFFETNKLVAAICHGPWLLVECGAARGRTLTSYLSIKTDLQNAGAHWTDDEVVIDRNLITSRKPDDLPAFNKAIIEQLGRTRRS